VPVLRGDRGTVRTGHPLVAPLPCRREPGADRPQQTATAPPDGPCGHGTGPHSHGAPRAAPRRHAPARAPHRRPAHPVPCQVGLPGGSRGRVRSPARPADRRRSGSATPPRVRVSGHQRTPRTGRQAATSSRWWMIAAGRWRLLVGPGPCCSTGCPRPSRGANPTRARSSSPPHGAACCPWHPPCAGAPAHPRVDGTVERVQRTCQAALWDGVTGSDLASGERDLHAAVRFDHTARLYRALAYPTPTPVAPAHRAHRAAAHLS
jgi:hypothetical protein